MAEKESSFEQEARRRAKVDGLGGAVISDARRQIEKVPEPKSKSERQVWAALANLEQDSK